MRTTAERGFVFWAPRLLTLIFAGFLSLTALDVFGSNAGFWRTLLALALHLIPVIVLLAVLALAWHWEWIGAVVFGALATAFALGPLQPAHIRRWPLQARLLLDVEVAGPVFVIAALFLVGWLHRSRSDATVKS